MSIKMESKQRTPSVIARLMGLDELAPHQPVQKKKRVLSENYLKRVASIGVREKRHSFRLGIDEKKKLKDVVDVLEKIKTQKDYNLSGKKGKVNLRASEVKMAIMSQKFVDANCGSMNLWLHTSKEGHNALGVLDLKINPSAIDLQEADSLITNHVHDLQGVHQYPQSGRIKVLNLAHASDRGKTDIGKKSWRGIDQGSAEMLQKLETGLLTDSQLGLGNKLKLLRSQVHSDNEMCPPKTKIVVLKPSLESSSFGDSQSVSKRSKEFLCPEKGDIYIGKERKNVAKEVKPAGLIAKELGHGKYKLSAKASRLGSQDCDTSAKESELMLISSPNSSYRKNRYRPSFHRSERSYVGREARKESLERWKTTEKFQEVEVADQCRTLGEMPPMSDHKSRRKSLDFRLDEHISSQSSLHSNCFMVPLASANWLQHKSRKQGYNQKDGLKSRNSGSSCTMSGNSYSVQDDHVLHGELKRKLEEKDPYKKIYLVNSSGCNDICRDSEHRCAIQESIAIREEFKNKLEEKDLSEQNSIVPGSSIFSVASDSMVSEMTTDAETAFVGRSYENHRSKDFEPTECSLSREDGNYSSQVPDTSIQQDMSFGMSQEDTFSSICSCTDFESLVHLEAAYQPSPNSVLEPPFEREISSSPKCFRGVKADLHGLHLQLELLKSESLEVYSEGAGMIVSSDDDSEEGFVSNSGENEEFMRIFCVEESRDFSYLVDVFTEAGYHGRNSDLDHETWYSSECPISPAVFDMLEKKYGEQISWKRSERRLLFDRINSELREIVQTSIWMNWTKPLSRRLCFRKSLEAVEEELWMALTRHEKLVNKDSSVKLLGKDEGWLELGDDIEVIVTELENSLIDQLAAEVVSMDSF